MQGDGGPHDQLIDVGRREASDKIQHCFMKINSTK